MLSVNELTALVSVVILLVIMMLSLSNRSTCNKYMSDQSCDDDDYSNMRHTNYNGKRLQSQSLPSPYSGGVSEFMNARYKVIVDEDTEPLNDICIEGFKNPAALSGKMDSLPKTSQTFWGSTKSNPNLAGDDKQLEHDAAEMLTPAHRVQMSKKSKRFLPFTGGKSRMNFASFEHSTSEAPFRQ